MKLAWVQRSSLPGGWWQPLRAPDARAPRRHEPFGEVESTKSVSDLYSPVSGTIVQRNDGLDEAPELINSDPYGQGWLIVVEMTDGDELEQLMDAEAYS